MIGGGDFFLILFYSILFFHFHFSLNNVAEIEPAVTTPLHRDALLGHDRGDKLCGRDVKARIVNPVESFGRNHDRSLGPVTLGIGIHGRRIQRPAHDTRFQWRTVLDWYAFFYFLGGDNEER